jgi:hypothetical protein
MKFLFNLNLKLNLGLLLGLVILASLFIIGKSKQQKEGFDEYWGNSQSESRADVIQARADADTLGNQYSGYLDDSADEVISDLDTVANFFDTSTTVLDPQWRHVYGDGTSVPDTVTTGLKPDTSFILTDGCSTKSIIKSAYEEDICEANIGDYQTIDAKCKALSNDNCNLPSCCVLLNGNKCVAGNIHGPNYLTDQGNTIDYSYYLYRNKCYGKGCDDSNNKVQSACGSYAKNSTGVSQECMVAIFNDAGCLNPSPIYVVNDDYSYNNSKTSLQYIKNDLTATAKALLVDITKGNNDSRVKCSGNPSSNPCDIFLSGDTGISKACMIRTFNDAGCPNAVPSFITDTFVDQYSNLTKVNMKKFIQDTTAAIKTTPDETNLALCNGNITRRH